MWQTVGESQILAHTTDQGTVVGDLSRQGDSWSAMVFGRGFGGNFRQARMFDDEEEAKNWITKKIKQILQILGIGKEGKSVIPGFFVIHLPKGSKIYPERTKSYRLPRHGVTALSVSYGEGFAFRLGTQRCYVPRGVAQVVPTIRNFKTSSKATWYQWIAKDLEKAGTTTGDGFQLLTKAFNRLGKAVNRSPDPVRAKRAYSKAKLALTLLDHSLDQILEAQKIIMRASR
jgi:hypothetical protein